MSKFMLYSLFLILLLWSFAGSETLVSEVLEYVTTKTHIIFVVDGASTISVDDWALMKQGLKTIFERANTDKAIASLIVYSYYVSNIFSHRAMGSHKDDCIKDIEDLVQPRSRSYLGAALIEAQELISTGPKDYNKVIVVFTDGHPTDDTRDPAYALKKMKCRIISIGFGTFDSRFLTEISGNDVLLVSQFVELVDILNLETSTSDEISVEGTIKNETLSFRSDLKLNVKIRNNGELDIPPGCKIELTEVARFPPNKHFHLRILKIDEAIPAGKSHSLDTTLETTTQANIRTLPNYIKYSLTCKSMQLVGRITLETHYFVGDVIKFFDGKYKNINLLLVGPVGSGKTTLKNLFTSVLSSRKDRILAGVEGPGDTWHTTNHTIIINVGQFYDGDDGQKLRNVSLRIVDTQGIDATNFDNNFMHFLLEGVVPDGTEGASGDKAMAFSEELEKRKNKKTAFEKIARSIESLISGNKDKPDVLAKVVHTVVFVVSSQIISKDRELAKLRLNADIAKSKGYSPVVAITHMDYAMEENWPHILLTVPKSMGLAAGSAFPIALGNTASFERVFESDIQTLSLLQQALSNAKTWLQAQDKKSKDEL